MTTRRDLLLNAGAAGAIAAAGPGVAAPAGADGDGRLTRVFDAMSDDLLVASPETATQLGLDVGARAALKHRLGDRSVADHAHQVAFCRTRASELAAVPDAALSPAMRLNKAVIGYALELGREAAPYDFGKNSLGSATSESAGPYIMDQQSGLYSQLAEFLDSQHHIATRDDAEAYLDRLAAAPKVMDQETEQLRRDTAMGVVAPNFLLANALGQVGPMTHEDAASSRLVRSLADRAKAKGIEGDWAGRATKLVDGGVKPALARQQAALQVAAAKADDRAGVWKLKDGDAYYAWLLKAGANSRMTADEVHTLGLEQNREIEARMDGLLKAQGLTQGAVGDRMTALAADPRFTFPETDAGRAEVIAYLNDRIAAVRARLPRASALSLKAPVDVKRVPASIQDGAGLGYMNTGSLDGSRPSTYYINLKSTANWPKFSLPSLTFHETIPGHAWQGAYLTEKQAFPLIRQLLAGFNAYIEGWALYSEQLADEIGMYDDDPFGRLGYLQAQKFRAVRLVVDTGLHSKRWAREKAIAFAVENSGRTRAAMTSEIDRYCSTPGQACGYKVGHTEINRLRAKAKAALGAKFDLPAFDDAVITTGPSPMTVLETVVDAHVAARRSA